MTRDDRPVLVLDGDPRPELARRRIPLRPAPGALPLPIREPDGVHALLVDSVLAGADVVTAMTGDLHRRALARMGAARRVREWIGVAVGLARDAAREAEDAGRPPRNGEPAPPLRVAGLVWPLEDGGGPEAAPDAAVASAEHRAHAGALADAGAAILRIERIETVAESESATLAALETGLETWTGIVLDETGVALPSGEPLSAWLSVVAPLGPAALLLQARSWDATAAGLDAARAALDTLDPRGAIALGVALPSEAPTPPPEGALPSEEESTPEGHTPSERALRPEARLLGTGATLLSAGPDGSPRRVALLRATADAEQTARAGNRRLRRDGMAVWLAQAADRALPGPALWLEIAPATSSGVALPDRFSWQVVDPATLRLLPAEHYRLAVVPGADLRTTLDGGPAHWVRPLVDALEPGAWLLVEGAEAPDAMTSDPRLGEIRPADPSVSGASSWLARRRP